MDIGGGITMIVVGALLAVATGLIGFAWSRIMGNIINVWTNWRTLPVLIIFWVASTGLVIGGIYLIAAPKSHSKHTFHRIGEAPLKASL